MSSEPVSGEPVNGEPALNGLGAAGVVVLVVGQTLYTLGSSVGSGTVFRYFLLDWKLPAFVMTIYLVVPELMQTVAVTAGGRVQKCRSAKGVWLRWAVASRVLALGSALLAMTDSGQASRLVAGGMIALHAAAEAVQAVSYVALVVWMSRIVSSETWGRTFGARRVGVVFGMMAVPAVLSLWGQTRAEGAADLVRGHLLVLAAIGTLAILRSDASETTSDAEAAGRDRSLQSRTPRSVAGTWGRLREVFGVRSVQRLVYCSLHLSAAQGLTQYVFFRYAASALEVEPSTKSSLVALMFGVQLPASLLAGFAVDRFGGRAVYTAGVLTTAAAVPCWLMADTNLAWLYAAYVLFGAFGAVNVAVQTLPLTMAPQELRSEAVALVRFGGGLLAAVTALSVGPLLGDNVETRSADPWSIWIVLMIVSFVGRVTAPLWLWCYDGSAGRNADGQT